ncbi:c-type cytochrome [Pusillimonas sp. ANT_WB101]|uniref:c-type cytochrome n=1 Tax=Pusillimonas sp. ANT_WB101 TaxID=2597356 RepID=UPI0011EC43F6|nr:c-type cytochrome [Pusillimonas sp. ANT_WB101]KAA0892762.1 c-type cytochrome [Pusillimonas sp. ANT_WB101]
MSCGEGKPCLEANYRRMALIVLFFMMLIFLGLSAVSFIDSRNQVTPDTISFGSHEAVAGKRVFQAYNCMGCHTMVGNGGYLGPDLTNTYEHAGSAWLAAFLPSAGTWPTSGALKIQLQDKGHATDSGAASLDDYYKKYPGAAERVQRRGGHASIMPNLPLTADEVSSLIAYLKYTSAMNTEGWPPKPKVDGLTFKYASPGLNMAVAESVSAAATVATTEAVDPTTRGAQLVKDYACTACHAADKQKLVGPGWGGLYGSNVTLTDGTTVVADDAYLTEAVRNANAQIVAGYTAGVMPEYANMLKNDEVAAIVAYIRSLQENGK